MHWRRSYELRPGIFATPPLLQPSSPCVHGIYLPRRHVTFEPGVRTAWHTHPLGQTLLIVSGVGWVQREGGAIEQVRPGDVVWFPPGLKHWHGASTNAMRHIAVQESLDGKNVEWMEQVTDAQYVASVSVQ